MTAISHREIIVGTVEENPDEEIDVRKEEEEKRIADPFTRLHGHLADHVAIKFDRAHIIPTMSEYPISSPAD